MSSNLDANPGLKRRTGCSDSDPSQIIPKKRRTGRSKNGPSQITSHDGERNDSPTIGQFDGSTARNNSPEGQLSNDPPEDPNPERSDSDTDIFANLGRRQSFRSPISDPTWNQSQRGGWGDSPTGDLAIADDGMSLTTTPESKRSDSPPEPLTIESLAGNLGLDVSQADAWIDSLPGTESVPSLMNSSESERDRFPDVIESSIINLGLNTSQEGQRRLIWHHSSDPTRNTNNKRGSPPPEPNPSMTTTHERKRSSNRPRPRNYRSLRHIITTDQGMIDSLRRSLSELVSLSLNSHVNPHPPENLLHPEIISRLHS